MDAALNHLFSFQTQFFEVFKIEAGSYQYQFDHVGVQAHGQVANDVRFFDGSQLFDQIVCDSIDAGVFAHDPEDVVVQRVVGIGPEDLAVAFEVAFKKTGRFETVQFEPDRVGRFVEFSFKSAQITLAVGIQKKPEQ